LDFTITLSDDDWDSVKGGWRCPALQIPATQVKNVYVSGSTVDPKLYDVNNELCLIRWSSGSHPRQAAVHIQAQKALSTEELTSRWKKIAIVLPVVGALAAALLTARLNPGRQPSATSSVNNTDKIPSVYEQSNDFLASGSKYQLVAILKGTKREAWLMGTTFYISTDQFHDLMLSRLADGVDLNFLILDPYNGGAARVARLLGVTEEELFLDCLAGIRTLSRMGEEAKSRSYSGTLRVKLIQDAFQSRAYFFDPKSSDGFTYYIPQINGTNSQFLPGFLVGNGAAKFATTYFNGVLKLWNSQGAQSLESWKSSHPDSK
jgi:hypothetical protein